jgi:hypothetical protein
VDQDARLANNNAANLPLSPQIEFNYCFSACPILFPDLVVTVTSFWFAAFHQRLHLRHPLYKQMD